MRLALGIEYCGTAYTGWQKQDDPKLVTIQGCVERAVSQVANEPVEVVCSGRTDQGVHALCQVAHFDTTAKREERAWVMGINRYLPHDIRVVFAQEKAPDFHARYQAKRRRYVYLIYNRNEPSALLRERVMWVYQSLNADAMHQAAQYLLGENDFSAFRAVGCQSKSVHRNLSELSVKRNGDTITVDIVGNAFLYHMVRNIVGSLILVGKGDQPVEWMKEVLDARDRKLAGPTADACGLYYVGPDYD